MNKSFHNNDPVIDYCTTLTVKYDSLQQELQEATLKDRHSGMLGAPEVLQAGTNFIRLIQAKKALDIGTYTGASALAWSLAVPADGKVLSFDVSHDALKRVGLPVIEKNPAIRNKIDFKLGSAVEKLDHLIADGESGTFDFAFIDADKANYPNYYKKCMQLLRKGGVIMVDNSLWGGRVAQENKDENATAINECNVLISNDPNSDSMLLTTGDGLHVAFKK